jgi:hypothetical protein
MLTSILHSLNAVADLHINETDWNIESLEAMRNNFDAACTGLDAVLVADFLVENGVMRPVTYAQFAQKFNIDELRAQAIIAYVSIMLKTAPDLFRM